MKRLLALSVLLSVTLPAHAGFMAGVVDRVSGPEHLLDVIRAWLGV